MNSVKPLRIRYVGGWHYDNFGDYAIKKGFKKIFLKCNISDKFRNPNLTCLVGGTTGPTWVAELLNDIDFGIPGVIFGTGICRKYIVPWKHNLVVDCSVSKNDWKDISNQAMFIGVRTPDCAKILESWDVKNVKVIGDPALSLCEPKLQSSHSKRVGVSLGSSWKSFGNQDKVDKVVAGIIKHLLDDGYFVELLPALKQEVIHNTNFILKYGLIGVKIHRNFRSVEERIRKIKGYDFVISQRLHPSIISMGCGVPAISLAYHDKCINFMKSFGMEKFIVRTDNINERKILNLIEDIKDNYKIYSGKLVEKTLYYKRVQERAAKKILFAKRQKSSLSYYLMRAKIFFSDFFGLS